MLFDPKIAPGLDPALTQEFLRGFWEGSGDLPLQWRYALDSEIGR